MPHNLLKRRRGVVSLIELIFSVVMFSLLLVVMIRLLATTAEWTDKTKDAFQNNIDANYFADRLQIDLKSATILNVEEETLVVMREDEVHTYTFAETKMFRDDKAVLYNIESGMFVPDEGSGTSVGIYIRMDNGDVYDLTLCR